MDMKQFAELVHSLREAGRVARGERKPAPLAGDDELTGLCEQVIGFVEGDVAKTTLWFRRSIPLLGDITPREVIATIFKGVDSRVKSGYLLRDVINKIAAIHFTSSDESHTRGALYESMLREMRDAATPKPQILVTKDGWFACNLVTQLAQRKGQNGQLVSAATARSLDISTRRFIQLGWSN